MKLSSGLALLAVGAALAYWIKKRQFERGRKEKSLSSFPKMVITNALERAAWTVAVICIVIGGLLFL
jgi:hypothetical protein